MDLVHLCTYKNPNELKNLIKKAPLIWSENIENFEYHSRMFLENYSEDKIFNNLQKIVENL